VTSTNLRRLFVNLVLAASASGPTVGIRNLISLDNLSQNGSNKINSLPESFSGRRHTDAAFRAKPLKGTN
jgi:hypothetical protein